MYITTEPKSFCSSLSLRRINAHADSATVLLLPDMMGCLSNCSISASNRSSQYNADAESRLIKDSHRVDECHLNNAATGTYSINSLARFPTR